MSDLPKGWETKKLRELLNFKYGKGLPQEKRCDEGSVKVFGSNGLIGTHDVAITQGPTIIIGRKGSVGEVHLSQESCWPIDTTYFVDEFPGDIPPRYWSYYLKSLHLGQQEKSSAIPGVNREDIYKIEAAVPPLSEQRRIVAKLEELLDKVDACKKRLERIPAILKRFRQSVLAAACSGRLTADWRDSNEKDCSMNWTSTKLGNLTSIVTSGSRGWAKYYSQNGAIFIRAQNINADYLDLSDIAYVNLPDRAEGLRTKVRKNDLLVTITGANVTKSAIVHEELDDAYVSQHVALVRPKDTKLSLFLFYWLLSPAHGRAQLLESAYGQGKPGLNLDNIRNVDVSVPTDPERYEIVRRVEALFKVADQIEARYAKAKVHVDKLSLSILAKAFRGELVPQDPDDEPASVLLDRIRTKRTAAPQPSSERRRTKASSHIKRSGRRKSVKQETAS
jgi:type I restriction enzyme, S subunit